MEIYFKILFWFHILFVSALMFYIGFARNKTLIGFYYLLGILGTIIIFYHSYKIAYKPLKLIFWNYFHLFIIGPLFILLAFYNKKTPTIFYDILIGLGAAALIINIYFLSSH